MIVNMTPHNLPSNDKMKDGLKKLFLGTRINASIFDTSDTGLKASIARTSNSLLLEIYSKNWSIDVAYECKLSKGEYLDVSISMRSRSADVPVIVIDYMTKLSRQYGLSR